jgi:hypothetical protein
MEQLMDTFQLGSRDINILGMIIELRTGTLQSCLMVPLTELTIECRRFDLLRLEFDI